ncbi:hypothetical protein Hdeb2414_s0015g00447761 [Helianthus debilis subsp. tardiflorus]
MYSPNRHTHVTLIKKYVTCMCDRSLKQKTLPYFPMVITATAAATVALFPSSVLSLSFELSLSRTPSLGKYLCLIWLEVIRVTWLRFLLGVELLSICLLFVVKVAETYELMMFWIAYGLVVALGFRYGSNLGF